MRDGFYLFVAYYGVQRFLWEFLKPYPTVLGPFNVFHLFCIAMIVYSIFMIAGSSPSRFPSLEKGGSERRDPGLDPGEGRSGEGS